MSFWRKQVIQPALDSAELETSREQMKRLEANPSDPKPHFALGTLAHLRGRIDEAIAHFTRAIELDPDYAPAHASLGRIFAVQGDYERAWDEAMAAERLGDRSLAAQLERYSCAARSKDRRGDAV